MARQRLDLSQRGLGLALDPGDQLATREDIMSKVDDLAGCPDAVVGVAVETLIIFQLIQSIVASSSPYGCSTGPAVSLEWYTQGGGG